MCASETQGNLPFAEVRQASRLMSDQPSQQHLLRQHTEMMFNPCMIVFVQADGMMGIGEGHSLSDEHADALLKQNPVIKEESCASLHPCIQACTLAPCEASLAVKHGEWELVLNIDQHVACARLGVWYVNLHATLAHLQCAALNESAATPCQIRRSLLSPVPENCQSRPPPSLRGLKPSCLQGCSVMTWPSLTHVLSLCSDGTCPLLRGALIPGHPGLQHALRHVPPQGCIQP